MALLPNAKTAKSSATIAVARPLRNRRVSFENGIVIKMCFGDHAPPHFHAEYEEIKQLSMKEELNYERQ